MHGKGMSIGALARHTECSVDTIRYYERIKLLPPVPRNRGGHREFGAEHIQRLRFVRNTRKLGLSIGEVRDLLARIDSDSYDCHAMRSLLTTHVFDVRRRIAELKDLETGFAELLDACGDGNLRSCRVIETMLGRGVPAAMCCNQLGQ